jgi:uncharacterized membrane protein YgcG
MTQRRRMQGWIGPHTLVPAVAALLLAAGCDAADGDDGPDYVAVCTDRSGARVDDAKCAHAPETYQGTVFDAADTVLWCYLPTTSGYTAPPVGSRVSGGTYRTPITVRADGSSDRVAVLQRGGVAPSGGSISRGGFGVSKGSAGGGRTGGSSGS